MQAIGGKVWKRRIAKPACNEPRHDEERAQRSSAQSSDLSYVTIMMTLMNLSFWLTVAFLASPM